MYDALIIGGGVSGVSCALIFGSAGKKPFMEGKKIGIIAHQKSSSLQNAIFNNAYGIAPNTLGSELLNSSIEHLQTLYPQIDIILQEKVVEIKQHTHYLEVTTNKNKYQTQKVIIGIGAGQPFTIAGLENYIQPHPKVAPEKNRIQLQNIDHQVTNTIYAIGTLAGHRSQLTIAAGSGASCATDILSEWNEGKPTQVHDVVGR
jgi:pyruvate/2-oxoglutarate dehydrogenase complex dihydrolipoamide dehydrogenase (E3) component